MITKVFKIELTGGRNVNNDVRSIKKTFDEMGKTITSTKSQLDLLLNVKGDSTQIAELTKKLEQLNKSYEALRQQKKAAETDAKREKDLAKELSAQKIREAKEREAAAKALRSEENARRSKVQADVAEERQARKNKSAQDALAGSYNATYQSFRNLYNIVKSTPKGQSLTFQGQLLGYDEAIVKLKGLAAAEQAFRRQFARDGLLVGEYTSGIIQAFKDLKIDDILKRQVEGAKQHLDNLKKKNDELVVAFRKAREEGSADFNKLEKEIHDNVIEMQSLKTAVAQAQTNIRGIGGIGSQITSGINNGVKELKRSIALFAGTYFGFQALFSAIQNGVFNAKELSDQTSDLEINLDKAAGGADDLVESLSKLQTRTKLTVLEDIANTALRAGVAEENLLGVTKAIDIIKTAFGKDFGDIETGTETLVKLINIFFEDGQVTEDRILKIGNAVRKLANETVASVPFINDFAGRMAGVRQIANITLPEVIGLGAGFEEFKQSAEVSSTVLVKVIPKMAKDLDTFAKIAGKSSDVFKNLLQDNPIEALLQVSEGLVQGKGDIEVFAEALKESGLEAGRATTIIATLGGKADIFRQRIALAGDAIEQTGAITDAFNRKNTNTAALIDKIGKKFADAANSTAFQVSLKVIAGLLLLLLNNIPALVTILGILAGAWAVQNVQLLALRGSILAYNILIARNMVLIGILTPLVRAYNGVLFVLSGLYNLAGKAAAFFGIAAKGATGPLGIVLALVTTLGAALVGLSKTMANTNNSLRDQNREFELSKQIQREARNAIAETQAKMEGLVAIIKDVSISEGTRLKAMKDLIAIDPAFSAALQGNTIDLTSLNNILKQVNENLQQKAELESAQALQKNTFSELVRLKTLKESLQVAKALKLGFAEITDEQQKLFSNKTSVGRIALTASILNSKISDSDFAQATKELDQQIELKNKELNEANTILKDKYKTVSGTIEDGTNSIAGASAAAVTPVEIDIAKLKQDIKDLDDQIDNFTGTQKKLNELVAKRKTLQDQLDKALGTDKKVNTRGSRLTGDQKDDFKDIDAIRDRLIAEERRKFLELQTDEKTYLQNVLKINNDAVRDKLKLVKGSTAEERKVIAELNLQKITDLQETNQKLFDIDNKAAENRLRNQEQIASLILDAQENDPTISNAARIKAKEDYFNTLLKGQIVFNQEQIAREKLYGVASIENEQKRKEAIEKIIQQLRQVQRSSPDAQIQDIRDAGEKQIAQFSIYYSKLRKAILTNDKITEKERQRQLDELQKAERRTILSAELAALTIEFKKVKELYENGLRSEKEYLQAKKNMEDKAAESEEPLLKSLDSFSKGIDGFIDSVGNLVKAGDLFEKEIGDTGISVGYVIAESFDVAREALANYYEAKRDAIQQEKEDHIEALDREKERVLARAESSEEEDAINRQYDQKKRAIEKQAGEKLKKQKLAEARIALIAEIANIAVASAANPANAVTFGAAGVAQFAILSGIALARYALNAAVINKQQFAKSGKVKRVGPGRINGEPNIPTQSNGDNMLATVRVGEVVLNERHQRMLGGPTVFRRIGVPGFATSGLVSAPQMGTTLRPPAFTQGFYSGSSSPSSDAMNDLQVMHAEVLSAIYATDKKPVILNSKKVTKQQTRTLRDVRLGQI